MSDSCLFFSVSILALVILGPACFADGGGDRITGRPFATRSEVIAKHGMAATSQPLVTQVARWVPHYSSGINCLKNPETRRARIHNEDLFWGPSSPTKKSLVHFRSMVPLTRPVIRTRNFVIRLRT